MQIPFADNIRYLRKKNGLSQSEMQQSCGISRATWSNYENGNSEPDIETILKISNFFGISVSDILQKKLETEGNLIENENNRQNSNLISNPIGNPMPQMVTKSPGEIIYTANALEMHTRLTIVEARLQDIEAQMQLTRPSK